MKKIILINFIITLLLIIIAHHYWPAGHAQVAAVTNESALERIKRTGTIRCGYNPWPPFFEKDANTGQLKGICKDMSDQIISLLGWKIDYIESAPGNEVTDLKNGKFDAVCGTGPWYINSIKEVSFTKPAFYAGTYIYGRMDENRFTEKSQLNKAGISFEAIDGDISFDLTQRFFPLAKLQSLPGITDPSAMMLSVATKKADVAIIDPVTVALYNRNNSSAPLKQLFPNQPIAVYGAGFSTRKEDTSLLETLNNITGMGINMNIPEPVLKKYDPEGALFINANKEYQQKMP